MDKIKLALYGAGMVGVSVCEAIKTLYENCEITAFLVTEKEGNPSTIFGIPVISLNEFNGKHVKILIATPENHHDVIAAELERRNLTDYICIDSEKEAILMERYYHAIHKFPSLHVCPPGNVKASMEVYMTRFHKDKPLKKPYTPPPWVRPIQAGAALTDERITELRDDSGDNISDKNGNYSELTALYWVGRHGGHLQDAGTLQPPYSAGNLYLGLFHYRRVLDIGEEDLYRIEGNDIDVVLPFPTVHFPAIDEHHRRYVREQDWEAMVQALRELAPEYERSMSCIFSRPYFYNFNMFIAKEHIFRDYCDWLFPILQRTEELSTPRGWERRDRYVGYLGENLTTLYFMYHQNNFRIAHTGRLMLI